MNKLYLVVLDFNTEMAELGNVGIFEGENKLEVQKKALKQFKLSEEVISRVHAFEINELPDGWSYYF